MVGGCDVDGGGGAGWALAEGAPVAADHLDVVVLLKL